MKKIAVFTSGGDAPGMNALIRAVVRSSIAKGIEVFGIVGGFSGMIEGNIIKLGRKETANIISLGGTILKTSRSKEFMQKGGRAAAAEKLKNNGIEGIIACGGDGTFHGAHDIWEEHKIPIVGTPGTIDNDLYGTDYTIGFDTAINTAAEAIDKIRDTADSHGRVFIVEVMGRHAGFIAMDVGISAGAEFIAVPETVTNLDQLYQRILTQGKQQRTIVIVGEGDEVGGATTFAQILKDQYEIDAKVTILGHIQRGGSPTVRDRVLASHLGVASVEALLAGKTDVMIGEINSKIAYTPLKDTWSKKKPIHEYQIQLADILT
ncbi:MAG: 6-phosphofructokinase [Ignavibacteria bacterium GWB2_35_12]|nr:MAG: 6-phosphofructokinase [Ignavibacteria bacterium GWB2_35_12]OGV21858.1 MAG: 6-phosphofructokinase [Ignavibacteria bacterium RIFOXYC2_FULL_35_21]